MAKKKHIKEVKRTLREEGRLEGLILDALRNTSPNPINYKQLAQATGLTGKVSVRDWEKALQYLVKKGRIEETQRGKYRIVLKETAIEGKLEIVKSGFGFVRLEDGKEIYVSAKKLNRAFDGDTVRVRIIKPGRADTLPEGEVIHIIQRGRTEFVGTVKTWNNYSYMNPDDPKVPHDFLIAGKDLKGAKDGEKVLVRMTGWKGNSPEAEVIKVLGKAGEHNTEMHAIVLQFGFRTEFPPELEEEAKNIPHEIPEKEIKKRRDFRQITTFTMDPADAKDFDDALSFKMLDNGNMEIGIHIADVSYYVRPATPIDKEAFARATSVYLVDRTIPMLPEVLSNDLCSLKPNVDRLTFSAVFEMSEDGKIHNEWFGRTVIHSDKRFAYEEAQEVLDKGKGEFFEELTALNKIAYKLREKRFKEGSINFEDDEVKFELDEKGKPIRLFRKVRKDTHKLIEDFMLLANRRVAHFVNKLKHDPELPFIYRIHDWPNSDKLQVLREFVALLGYKLDLSSTQSTVKSLNKLILDVEGKPEQHLIQSVAVRSMAKAIYSTQNIGHYGLAFEHYTHFTSPIRRYPDLLVHRMLAQYLDKKYEWDYSRLDTEAKHCSEMEKKATDAERASIKYKQVEYLEDKLGQEFTGIVTGVTNWGIYVELEESKSEGMIPLQELKDDYYDVDKEHYCVRGRMSGNVIRLGDKVMVEVKSADLQQRMIDFILIEVLEHRSGTGTDVKVDFNKGDKKSKGRGRGGSNKSGHHDKSRGKGKRR